jgi:glutaredoxin 3
MKPPIVGGLRSAIRRLTGKRPPRAADNESPTGKMYQPNKVRLFIKPYCGWCSQAMNWLDDQDIQYEVLDVIADDQAYDEMYRLSGQTLAPVIEVDGQVLADFGARELATWWKKLKPSGS